MRRSVLPWCFTLQLALLPFGVGGQVASPGGPASSASPLDPAKQPPAKTYHFFSDQGDHLKQLVEAGEFEQAATLYENQYSEYFSSRRGKFAPLIEVLTVGLDNVYKAAFDAARAELNPESFTGIKWSQVREALKKARALATAFSGLQVVKDTAKLPDNFVALSRAIDSADAYWSKEAVAEFTKFDIDQDFFSQYPVDIRQPVQLIEAAMPNMLQGMRAQGVDALLRFARTYKHHLSSSTARPLLATAYMEQSLGALPPSERLRAASKSLSDARELGLLPDRVPGVRIAFAEATSQTLLKEGQIEFPVSIELNLPFEVKKVSIDEALSADSSQFDYAIVLDVSLSRTLQSVQKRDEIPSQFLAGMREVPNPQYEQARMAVFQAQSRLSSHQAQYCYGAGCIGKAIGAGILASALQEAQGRFAATPMTLSQPVYNEYKFSASDVIAKKLVTANYYVINLSNRTYFKSIFDASEEKSFRIAYRLHDKDKDLSQHLRTYNSEKDIKQFNDAPFTVRISEVLEQYVKSAGQDQQIKSPVAMREELLSDKNAALAKYKETARLQSTTSAPNDTRFASVVVVHNPKGSIGTGFFVESDLVLTNYHVVEGSQFVEMKLHNGLETFGKVVKTDVRLDLALVKVQARGTPVSFFDGPIPLGSTVEAIGHPAGLNYSITRGVVSAVRKRPAAIGVGGKEVLFVQTDTPLNPGNSGGPLFLDGKVVGVNDFKFTARGIEGISFSIHFTEVQDFLKQTH